MKRTLTFLAAALLTVCGWFFADLAEDSRTLSGQILRLHVVAASDSREDQAVKLQVRDAILAQLQPCMEDVHSAEEAQQRLEARLPQLEAAANLTLRQAGHTDTACVTLTQEAFPTREYDSFRLPAGPYRSVRVTIGPGKGQNWWCVVFPELCSAATTEAFAQAASMGGLSQPLAGSLTGEYEVRFWLLDRIGDLRNFLRGDSA